MLEIPRKTNSVVCGCGFKVEGVATKELAIKMFVKHVCQPRIGLEREGWDTPPDAA